MKNQFNVSIKTPCSENFNHFSPTKSGGFCNSCEKEVIDFTKMNSKEIINYFKLKSTPNTCGRFNSTQLKTFNQVTKTNKRLNFIGGIGLAFLSFFYLAFTQAQDKITKAKDENNSEIKDISQEKTITVKGTVIDENGLPLPGKMLL
jgi:hypothetical protein